MLRYPPSTACPWCADPRCTWEQVPSVGTVYTYTQVHHAIQPELANRTPYMVLIVELDTQKGSPSVEDGLRVVGNLVNSDGSFASLQDVERVGIGSRVSMTFSKITEGLALPQWTLAQSDVPWRCPKE